MPSRAPASESVGPFARLEVAPEEQDLGERAHVKSGRDLRRQRLQPAAGALDQGPRPGARNLRPVGRLQRPVKPQVREASLRLEPRWRVHLCRGQEGREGIEVVPAADPALGTRLQRNGSASAEGVEHGVARPRVARDEGVGKARGKRPQVAAHGMKGVPPEARLRLPFVGWTRGGHG